MSTPILATKLYIPTPRRNVVLRPRLIEQLNEGLDRKLTLVSAPAGFGKTTLLTQWLSESGIPAAWLSLDAGDNDPARFLAYLVAALQTIAATLGAGVLSLLQASQQLPPEAILTVLLNEITTFPDHFVLVLDDYHVLDAKPIDQALTYLVEHLPRQMHLIIATREDPQLPLARLRAQGHLTEVRSAELRFPLAEAAAFLTQVMGLSLSEADIARLSDRTEGWIAGLQLAALSVQDHQDVSGFIQAFAGDHRYIVDYLVEEVLQHQPEPVRRFLLQTAILDQLHGPLCDAVTGQEEGSARLEALERGNFFVVPLDDTRQWYRYHHLFAEVLRTHLLAEQPSQVALLHRRASAWYEQQGAAADAIRHALAAKDFERAATLIELAVPAMRQSRQDAILLGWFKALPDEVVRRRPVLSVGYAYGLLSDGELDAVEGRLRDAERWLDAARNASEPTLTPTAEMVVIDEEEFRRLPALIAIYRAAHAQALGDVPNTIKYARQVLDLLPEEDHLGRGAATAFLGLASWVSGDLEAAHQMFADGMARVQMAGNLSDAISGTIALADIRMAQGHLREAMRAYERSLQMATEQGAPVLRGTADLYVGISELLCEHNDLDAATQHLLKSKELGERTGLPQNWSRWYTAMARIKQTQGDLDGALGLLHEAERVYTRDLFPNVRPVTALVTQMWVAQGRLGEALGWAREQSLSVENDLNYLREFEHITLARVLLAQYKSDHAERPLLEAMGFLERLRHAAEAGGRAGSVIEILVLQARAHQMQGNIPAALRPLERALALAEPEGYVRIFVDEGPPMLALLEEAAKHGGALHSVRHLLTAFGKTQDGAPARAVLIEPLSERELEVLRLLRTDLSGPEMARQLVVSLNTLRTHTKNVYSKLEVNNRRAAVRRAAELGLF